MLSRKFVKKYILLLLFAALPIQPITGVSTKDDLCHQLSKKNFSATIVIGSIAILLGFIFFNSRPKLDNNREKRGIEKNDQNQEASNKKKEVLDCMEQGKEKQEEISDAETVPGNVQNGLLLSNEEEESKEKAGSEKYLENEEFAVKEKDQAENLILRNRKIAESDELPDDMDGFERVDKPNLKHSCNSLMHTYLKALYVNGNVQNFFIEANNFSQGDRSKLRSDLPDEAYSGEESQKVECEVNRALEYIKKGRKNLSYVLKGNFEQVSGYDSVVKLNNNAEENIKESHDEIRKNYLDSIISVVWCLFDGALKEGDVFEQGAFNIDDKNLQDFFYNYIRFVNPDHDQMGWFWGNGNNPFVYRRISSHLKELAKKREILQYGIDIRFGEHEDAEELLPNKMRHLLFIPYDSNNCRFILKPEDHAMYFFGDIGGHAFGWFRSQKEQLGGGDIDREKYQRKERIPKEIIKEFDKLIQESSLGKEEQKKYKKEVRAWGIQKIIEIAAQLENSCVKSFAEGLKEKHDGLDIRFGREVVFDQEKLKELCVQN